MPAGSTLWGFLWALLCGLGGENRTQVRGMGWQIEESAGSESDPSEDPHPFEKTPYESFRIAVGSNSFEIQEHESMIHLSNSSDPKPHFDGTAYATLKHHAQMVLKFRLGLNIYTRSNRLRQASDIAVGDRDMEGGWIDIGWAMDTPYLMVVKSATDHRYSHCMDVFWREDDGEMDRADKNAEPWQCFELDNLQTPGRYPVWWGDAGLGPITGGKEWHESGNALVVTKPTLLQDILNTNGSGISYASGRETQFFLSNGASIHIFLPPSKIRIWQTPESTFCFSLLLSPQMLSPYRPKWAFCAYPKLRNAVSRTWKINQPKQSGLHPGLMKAERANLDLGSEIAESLSRYLEIKNQPDPYPRDGGPLWRIPLNSEPVDFAEEIIQIFRIKNPKMSKGLGEREWGGMLVPEGVWARGGGGERWRRAQKRLEDMGFFLFFEANWPLDTTDNLGEVVDGARSRCQNQTGLEDIRLVMSGDIDPTQTNNPNIQDAIQWILETFSGNSSTLLRITDTLHRLASGFVSISLRGPAWILPALPFKRLKISGDSLDVSIRYLQAMALMGPWYEIPPLLVNSTSISKSSIRRTLLLRQRIRPHLRSERQSSKPSIRPIFWLEGEEEGLLMSECGVNPYSQWFIGDGVVVAPILDTRFSHRNIYIPRGEWLDLMHSGANIVGPTCLRRYQVTILETPIFERLKVPTGRHLEI